MRTVLAIVLLALAVSAGCAGPASDGQPETTVESPETTSEVAETTTATRTTRTTITTASEPQKGDQFLSVSELNESRSMKFDASKRASFGNLSAERQQVVKKAIECDCSVKLDGEFDFNNKDRIEVVKYDGQWYFLRVSIV